MRIKKQIQNFIGTGQVKLALRLLGIIIENFQVYIGNDLERFIQQLILPVLAQKDPLLRFYCYKTVCYFCEFMVPDILEFHKELLQDAINVVNEFQSFQFQKQENFLQKCFLKTVDLALCVIELLAENLSVEDLKPYSEVILKSILFYFNLPKGYSKS